MHAHAKLLAPLSATPKNFGLFMEPEYVLAQSKTHSYLLRNYHVTNIMQYYCSWPDKGITM